MTFISKKWLIALAVIVVLVVIAYLAGIRIWISPAPAQAAIPPGAQLAAAAIYHGEGYTFNVGQKGGGWTFSVTFSLGSGGGSSSGSSSGTDHSYDGSGVYDNNGQEVPYDNGGGGGDGGSVGGTSSGGGADHCEDPNGKPITCPKPN